MGFGKEWLVLCFACVVVKRIATDINECTDHAGICGPAAMCINTVGSYRCQCHEGYVDDSGVPEQGRCMDKDECEVNTCGEYAVCFNTDGSFFCQCLAGFLNIWGSVNFTFNGHCTDINECTQPSVCGPDALCTNTIGSYQCTCRHGYVKDSSVLGQQRCVDAHIQPAIPPSDADEIPSPVDEGTARPTEEEGSAKGKVQLRTPHDDIALVPDVDKCTEQRDCGPNALCTNTTGSPRCTCRHGYEMDTSVPGLRRCLDRDECASADICGVGRCKNLDGSFWCTCPDGFTNFGNQNTPCSELDCDGFISKRVFPGLEDIYSLMRTSCLDLSGSAAPVDGAADGEALLERLFQTTDLILSASGAQSDGEDPDMTELLWGVEDSVRFIAPRLRRSTTRMDTSEIDAEITVQKGDIRPTGPLSLTSENAQLDTDWETASGTGPYPGFVVAALLSYKNLDKFTKRSFEDLKAREKRNVSFQINSNIVSVVVSNPEPHRLSRPVFITLRHSEAHVESEQLKYFCAYWNQNGAWVSDGCSRHEASNDTQTVCRCEHLSSFAVLMALYPLEHTFTLQLVTKICLVISLLCLIMCIFTFALCQSIRGTRTTIHLHLCICLFIADLVFLAGISRTKPVAGCRFVAALLHYFFLGVFSWMLLEGMQLYRMVVLVFNTTIRPLFLYSFGYGTPLCIVIISASISPLGYGTNQHCWLSLERGLVWSFFGPVCFIIVANTVVFVITIWKLAQKFDSLNPDMSKLQKIRAFTVTAVAQMCVLGLMWLFGAFLFQGSASPALAYVFTILNSLQGALVFIMHCLLSEQVRDEYARIFSCIRPTERKMTSDVPSSTNPSSSQSQPQGSGNGLNTEESQI